MLDLKELFWFAGLMEGEGWFGVTNHKSQQLRLSVCMVDKDVIDRVEKLFGFGIRSERSLPSGKTHYEWHVCAQEQAAGLMMTLLPLMGDRRAQRISECLEVWKSKPPNKKRWTHCARGHELSGDNLRIVMDGEYEKRRCRKCERIRTAKHRGKEQPCLTTQST